MSLSRPLDGRKQKDKRELMETLQSLIAMGYWSDPNIKDYAQLICDNIKDGFLPSGDAEGDQADESQNKDIPSGKKRQRPDPAQQNTASTSHLMPPESKKTAEKKLSKVTNSLVTKMEKFDDGFKWRRYGNKNINNEKYPRRYFRCAEKDCVAKKQVQQIDEVHFKIAYIEDHNCKPQAPPCDPGGSSPIWGELQLLDDVPLEYSLI